MLRFPFPACYYVPTAILVLLLQAVTIVTYVYSYLLHMITTCDAILQPDGELQEVVSTGDGLLLLLLLVSAPAGGPAAVLPASLALVPAVEQKLMVLELHTKVHKDFPITEKVPTVAFFWLKRGLNTISRSEPTTSLVSIDH